MGGGYPERYESKWSYLCEWPKVVLSCFVFSAYFLYFPVRDLFRQKHRISGKIAIRFSVTLRIRTRVGVSAGSRFEVKNVVPAGYTKRGAVYA